MPRGPPSTGLDALPTLAVVAPAPDRTRAEWPARFPWVEFQFFDVPLTAGRSRNIALEWADTRYLALLDADVTGEPSWLERCCERLAATDGTIAVPAVIYPKGVIHTVGNLEYENHVDGVTYVHKEHRYWGMPYHRTCALPAVQVDYAESHGFPSRHRTPQAGGRLRRRARRVRRGRHGASCACGRRHGVGRASRGGAHRSGQPDRARGCRSVLGALGSRGDRAFTAHFMDVWNVDVGEEGGFGEFVNAYNSRLGVLPRRYPRSGRSSSIARCTGSRSAPET